MEKNRTSHRLGSAGELGRGDSESFYLRAQHGRTDDVIVPLVGFENARIYAIMSFRLIGLICEWIDKFTDGLKMTTGKKCVMIYLLLLTVFVLVQPFVTEAYTVSYGDQNVEQWGGTIGGDLVQAYTKVTVSRATVLQSVSMFLQYAGSDGTQCMLFGIYQDNGSGSPAGQLLVAYTRNAYCLHGTGSWGPAWQTWKLFPSDYLMISTPGDYWLCTLAKQTYGSILHYSYSGAYDYTYGYANYFFASPYENGFPTTFTSTPGWESNAPYSFYMTGT